MRSRYPPLPGTGPVDPRFRVGDLVRYDSGSTALFKITDVYRSEDRCHRYYGIQCCGGVIGRYDYQLDMGSAEDKATWFDCEKWRKP